MISPRTIASLSLAFSLLLSSLILHGQVSGAVAASNGQSAVSDPLMVVQNVGQFAPAARFMIPYGRGQVWVAQDGLWLTQWQAPPVSQSGAAHLGRAGGRGGVHIKISFASSNPAAMMEPFQPSKARLSYLTGSDPHGWLSGVPGWGGLRIRQLYPGVDLVLDGAAGDPAAGGIPWRLETGHGANLAAVGLHIQGAQRAWLDERTIHLATSIGEISLPRLGVDGRALAELNALSLTEPANLTATAAQPGLFLPAAALFRPMDAPQRLPQNSSDLFYSTFLGGSNDEEGTSIAIDASGKAYLTGSTSSTNFPVTPGAFDSSLSQMDVFVARLAADGSQLEYATFLGGSESDTAYGVAISGQQAYLTGETYSTNFPLKNAYDATCGSDGTCNSDDGPYPDAFLTVLNADGSDLVYSSYLGGQDADTAYGIATASGAAYLTGITFSSDFPGGGYTRSGDAFVSKLDTSGGLGYSRLLGGLDVDAGFAIAVSGGEAYVTGETSSSDFGSGYSGLRDVFVARLNSSGGVIYKKVVGGSGDESGMSIALGSNGKIYLTGPTNSANFPVTQGALVGIRDAFVAVLDSTPSITYAAYLGGSQIDEGRGVGIDGQGAILVSGFSNSTNFPTSSDAYQSTSGGSYDGFITRIDLSSPLPGHIVYSSYLGGSGIDMIYGMAAESSGTVYLTGFTQSSNYPTTPGAYDTGWNGSNDAFASKLAAGPYASVRIKKYTGDQDADAPPGPKILASQAVNWNYIVSNLGKVSLGSVTVTDNRGVTVTCPKTTLAVGEAMTCTASGSATAGQYSNLGTVNAQPGGGLAAVQASDLSHYFGAAPAIAINKKTNGQDGSQILAGRPVSWTYTLTNPGNVPLSNVSVSDNKPGVTPVYQSGDLNSNGKLEPGETWNYAASGVAVAGAYANTGTASGAFTDDFSRTFTATANDGSSYLGASPAVSIVKVTNGSDGPQIVVGTPVTWTYTLANPGNVPLSNVSVSDNQPGVTPAYRSGDLNGNSKLETSETWVYRATSLAVQGAYANAGSVSASYADSHGNATTVNASDSSSYFGAAPAIAIAKTTNDGNGLDIRTGTPITWTYTVTNPGNVPLTNLSVSDNKPGVTPVYQSGDLNSNSKLEPNETWVYRANGSAIRGAYSNTGTAQARFTDYKGSLHPVSASAASSYFGFDYSLTLAKTTNGADGAQILAGTAVTWTYTLANPGNVPLASLVVTDSDKLVTPLFISGDLNSDNKLDPGETWLYRATSVATAGNYANTGGARGSYTDKQGILHTAQASDPSAYFGAAPAIAILKKTNGLDGNTPPGPYILVGQPVTWTFRITNTGNVPLTQVSVVDDNGTPGFSGDDFTSCSGLSLAQQASTVCTSVGIARKGAYANLAVASGAHLLAPAVTASDGSRYFGAAPTVSIEKFVEGQPADQSPGLIFRAGTVISFTYLVTNTGNVPLADLIVHDDQGTPQNPLDDIQVCTLSNLLEDQSQSCQANHTVAAGALASQAGVSGTAPVGPPVVGSDPAYLYGYRPDQVIGMQLLTNEVDVDAPPGVSIWVSDPVTWTYRIYNFTAVDVENISVQDDNGTPTPPDDDLAVCTISSLPPLSWTTCTRSAPAELGQYSNIAMASTIFNNELVSESDQSYYYGKLRTLFLPLIRR